MATTSKTSRSGGQTAKKASGRKSSAGGTAELATMKVDELRDQLRKRGVTGVSTMRKADLVKTLVKTLREGESGATSARATTAGAAKKSMPAARPAKGGARPGGSRTSGSA